MVSQVEMFDLLHGVLPRRLAGAAGWQGEPRAISSPKKLGGHEQDLVPQRLQRGTRKFFGQAQSPEPVDQIVGQQEQMEVGLVGEEMVGRDTAHRVIPFELFDEQLDPGAIVVEPPALRGRKGRFVTRTW